MLLTVDQAAAQLNIPVRSLRRAAEEHGLLVRMGRAVRIDPETMPELIQKCRNAPKVRASTGTPQKASGSFETLADQKLQQAQQTAQMLKSNSPSISQKKTGQLARFPRKG